MSAHVKSPCILVCSIDLATGYCYGCGRTGEEIASWMDYGDEGRDAIMAQLPGRLTTIERKPRRETKRARTARLKREAAQ